MVARGPTGSLISNVCEAGRLVSSRSNQGKATAGQLYRDTDSIIAAWYYLSYTIGMKTAISLPDNVFRAADTLAKKLGLSRSQLYATAVAEYLVRRNGEQVSARLDQVYGANDGRPDAGLVALAARPAAREDSW